MLSILIVNWNTKELLHNCLNSIYSSPPQCPFEVIVVDNNSKDQSEEMVKTQFPQATLVQTHANTGYAQGNNIAFKHAKGEYLLTLNPDTEIPSNTLDQAINILQQKPQVAALSVKFIGPDSETQKSVRNFPTILNILGEITRLAKLFPHSNIGNYLLPKFNYNLSQPAPQPMGTFLLFSRKTLASAADPTAPFDPQFPIFFNEVDLLKRLADKGYTAWYESSLQIFHHHGGSTRQVKKSMIWESHKSLVKYFNKHLKGSARILLPAIAIASYSAAFIRARGYHAGFRPEHHNL